MIWVVDNFYSKCKFLRQLTINRKERREANERKLKELKMTPEYGMNAAKLRLKKKKLKEEKYYNDKG